MKKNTYLFLNIFKVNAAFFIAIILHVAILLFSVSIFTEGDNEKVEGHSLIPIMMRMGNGRTNGGSVERTPHSPIPSHKKSSPEEISLNQMPDKASDSSKGTSAGTGGGTGTGIGTGIGNGNESGTGAGFGFDESVVNFNEPSYPIVALKRNIEGRVKIQIKVSEEGVPMETIVILSSNSKVLDQAALDVIPNWRFQKRPGIKFYIVVKTFVFKINN
jgi:TonB family protein